MPPSLLSALQEQLSPALQAVAPLDPVALLAKLLDAWEIISRLWEKARFRGPYDILDYDSTLEFVDPQGQTAILTRRQVLRFLQDNVVAIHDHAWGDGELFASYKCQPGLPVDFYRDGSRHNVLISLRETKDKGDLVEFWIERIIQGGFLQEHEWFETGIDHWMHKLRVRIIFPKARPCRRATLSRRSTAKTLLLPSSQFALLPDGRQVLTWETAHPRLHDCYTIKWVW